MGNNHPVEAHEKWSYNHDTHVQKLEGLMALCPACHKTQHWGFALIHGLEPVVRKQIKKVNGWKDEDVDKYIQEAFALFDYRSRINWTLDLSYLDGMKKKQMVTLNLSLRERFFFCTKKQHLHEGDAVFLHCFTSY